MKLVLVKVFALMLVCLAASACGGETETDPEFNGPIELSQSSTLEAGIIRIDLGFILDLKKNPTWENWNRDFYELLYAIRRDVPYSMDVGILVADDVLKNAPSDLQLSEIIFPVLTSRYHYWLILSCYELNVIERHVEFLRGNSIYYRNALEFEEGVEIATNSKSCPRSKEVNQDNSEFLELSNTLVNVGFAESISIDNETTLVVVAGDSFPRSKPTSAALELSNLAHFATQVGDEIEYIKVLGKGDDVIFSVTKNELDEEIRKMYVK